MLTDRGAAYFDTWQWFNLSNTWFCCLYFVQLRIAKVKPLPCIKVRSTSIGQHPRKYADTYIMLEQVGHRLDREVERLFNLAEAEGLTGMGVTNYIEEHIDLANVPAFSPVKSGMGDMSFAD